MNGGATGTISRHRIALINVTGSDTFKFCAWGEQVTRTYPPSSEHEREGVLHGYVAPQLWELGEAHLSHAARLRLNEVLLLVDRIEVEVVGKRPDGLLLVDVKFWNRDDDMEHDLVDCLIKEGWGTRRPSFAAAGYPFKA